MAVMVQKVLNLRLPAWAGVAVAACSLFASCQKSMPFSTSPNPKSSDTSPDPSSSPPLNPANAADGLGTSIRITLRIHREGGGLYVEKIAPTILKSCAIGGCHAQSDVIDLRTFPFSAEGSYALDSIKSDLGPNPAPDRIQRSLVAHLISSMKTGYMPPSWSTAPSVAEADIQSFTDWLDDDLKTEFPPFTGTLKLTSATETGAVCTQEWPVIRDLFEATFDKSICQLGTSVTYSLADSSSTIVSSASINTNEILLTGLWAIELRISTAKVVNRGFIRNQTR